jgi:hypothetical protein
MRGPLAVRRELSEHLDAWVSRVAVPPEAGAVHRSPAYVNTTLSPRMSGKRSSLVCADAEIEANDTIIAIRKPRQVLRASSSSVMSW